MAQDEYGRPFIVVREGSRSRITGLEAQKVMNCYDGKKPAHLNILFFFYCLHNMRLSVYLNLKYLNLFE